MLTESMIAAGANILMDQLEAGPHSARSVAKEVYERMKALEGVTLTSVALADTDITAEMIESGAAELRRSGMLPHNADSWSVSELAKDTYRAMRGRAAHREIEITEEMISAGVFALRGTCPFDVAFPAGGEDEAVENVLIAALQVHRDQTHAWSLEDAMKEVYGDCNDGEHFEWEREIVDALKGIVPLAVAVRILRAAHEAEREGAASALRDC